MAPDIYRDPVRNKAVKKIRIIINDMLRGLHMQYQ